MIKNKGNYKMLVLYLLLIVMISGLIINLLQIQQLQTKFDDLNDSIEKPSYLSTNNKVCQNNYIVKISDGTTWRNCYLTRENIEFIYPESLEFKVDDLDLADYMGNGDTVNEVSIGYMKLYWGSSLEYLTENPQHIPTDEDPLDLDGLYYNDDIRFFDKYEFGEGFVPKDGCGGNTQSIRYISKLEDDFMISINYVKNTKECGNSSKYSEFIFPDKNELEMYSEILESMGINLAIM